MQRVLARRLLGLVPESKTGLERLIDKKRESYELQTELDHKKEDHKTKMKMFSEKAKGLEAKNLENQEEVVSKDAYVRDNWRKRQREEERLQSEATLLKTKQKELEDLQNQLEALQERKKAIEIQLQASLPYKHYLDSVFEAAPEMVSNSSVNEVQGIVTKHQTMTEYRSQLQVRLMRSQQILKQLKDAMAMYDDSSTNFSVEVDYQLKVIAQAQEASFKQFGRQRHQQEAQANQNRIKAEEAALIRLSIDNMYQKAKTWSSFMSKFKKKEDERMTLLAKFNYVKDLIDDMKEIVEQIEQK